MERLPTTSALKDNKGENWTQRLKRSLQNQNKVKLRQKLRMAAAFFPPVESDSDFKKSTLPSKYRMLLDAWSPYSAIEEDHDSSTEYSFSHSQEAQKLDTINELDHCLRVLFDDEIISTPQKSKERETEQSQGEGTPLEVPFSSSSTEISPSHQSLYERLKARNIKKQRRALEESKINLNAASTAFEPEDEFLGKKKQKKLSYQSSEFKEENCLSTKQNNSLLGTLLSHRVNYHASDSFRGPSFGISVPFSAS